MEILGYILAVLIGVLLGLIGGGGSILTVPVLVYVLGINPVLATAYSLFIVGASSLLGAINNFRKGLVSIKTAIIFAIPAFIAVYLTRLFIVPAIPETILELNNFSINRDSGIMLFFALLMILAAISMFRKSKNEVVCNEDILSIHYNYPLIGLEGVIVGVLTGIVGAGGGFLIIPALVLLARLPMKLAVGTSLFIIAAKSLIGFVGDIQAGQIIEWKFLMLFTSCSIAGVLLGGYFSNFIAGHLLKRGFAWFVLIMAISIIIKEII